MAFAILLFMLLAAAGGANVIVQMHGSTTPEGKKTETEKPWILESIADDQKKRLVERGTPGRGGSNFRSTSRYSGVPSE